MKAWPRRMIWAGVGLLVVLAIVTADFLHHGGQFEPLGPPTNQACTSVPLQVSAEDLQPDRSRRLVYLSALDRRGLVEGREVSGDVLQLDLTVEPALISSALASRPANFRPHGMSLYRMGDGSARLFVINHPPEAAHEILVFEQGSDGLFVPIEVLRDPLLIAPNAIVAIGPRSFYVANDKGSSSAFGRLSEIVLRRGRSTIVLHDDTGMRVVADGLKSASGLALSPDGSRLYVAETVGKDVRVFSRDLVSNDLSSLTSIAVPGAPDNLGTDPDGVVWIAVHPKTLDLIRHFGDASHPAPTRIMRLSGTATGGSELIQVFLDEGTRISAGSGGTVIDGELLIGSITDRKVLRCRLTESLGDTP